jgi:hypothetical protein
MVSRNEKILLGMVYILKKWEKEKIVCSVWWAVKYWIVDFMSVIMLVTHIIYGISFLLALIYFNSIRQLSVAFLRHVRALE